MKTIAKFNFTDWKGDAHTGEVFQSRDGAYIPDSILGMGKNYTNPAHGVDDYLRRMGGTLSSFFIVREAQK